MQNIALNKKGLEDLSYLTRFCHTGVLEIYHSMYNKWVLKRQHFPYLGVLARSQLAIIDFNEGSNLEQATTEKGEKRYNEQFSKITKSYLHRMVKGLLNVYGKKSIRKNLSP